MKQIPDRDYQQMMNSPEVQHAVDLRADAIVAGTRRRTRVDSGDTRASVTKVTEMRDDGVLERRVGYDLAVSDSAPYYVFGTEDTPPHPDLVVAAKAVRGKR